MLMIVTAYSRQTNGRALVEWADDRADAFLCRPKRQQLRLSSLARVADTKVGESPRGWWIYWLAVVCREKYGGPVAGAHIRSLLAGQLRNLDVCLQVSEEKLQNALKGLGFTRRLGNKGGGFGLAPEAQLLVHDLTPLPQRER